MTDSFLKKIERKIKSSNYSAYTFCFLVFILVLYGGLFVFGKATNIHQVDGENQYLLALIYYSDWLKEILRELFLNHRLLIPEWDFAIGEGADIITTFTYYAIGDPLTLPCILFNTDNMYLFYELLTFFRLYFAGIAFLLLCRHKIGDMTNLQAVTCAFIYVFCGGISSSMGITAFLTPLIYFPLLVLGVERIFDGKKGTWLILTTFLCSMSNFYFFYICSLLLVIHTICRLVMTYRKDIRGFITCGFKILVSVCLGILMSMVLFMPIVSSYLLNPRIGAMEDIPILEDLDFFVSLPGSILLNRLDASFISILAIVVLFTIAKKNFLLKLYVILVFVMFSFTVTGSIFNGFSYSVDRWSFANTLISSYILALMWNELTENLKQKKFIVIAVLFAFFILCLIFNESRLLRAFINISVLLFAVLVLSDERVTVKLKGYTLLLVCLLSIGITFVENISPDGYGWLDELVKREAYTRRLYNKEGRAVTQVASADRLAGDDGFFRFSGSAINVNFNIIYKLSSTSFYWSTLSPYSWFFRKNIATRGNVHYIYTNYDDRTVANEISSVKYYISNNGNVPFGYSLADIVNVGEDIQNQKIEELKKIFGGGRT